MSAAGRPRNSEATKAALVAAARARFATDGFERTTVRLVAADVGIDPALVLRYFMNKDGLFAAAADVDLRLPDFSGVGRRRLGLRMAEHFFDRWEQDETFTALMRSAVTHPAARDRMEEVVGSQVVRLVAELVPDSDADTVSARAGLIAGQILGVALCRYVLRLPPLVDLPREELVAWLGASIQHTLTRGAAR